MNRSTLLGADGVKKQSTSGLRWTHGVSYVPQRVWAATGGSTALVRGINAGAALVATSLLARLLSSSDFGLFVLGQVGINGLSLLIVRGRDQLAAREMAALGVDSSETAALYLAWASRGVLRNGVAIALVAALAVSLAGQMSLVSMLVITTIPVLALTRLLRGVSQAMGRTATGVFYELATINIALAVLGSIYLATGASLGLVPVHATYLGAVVLSLVSLTTTLRAKSLGFSLTGAPGEPGLWRRSSDVLAVTAMMFFGLAYLETFVLAHASGTSAVGAYAISNRLAVMLSLAALPVAMVRGPRLARHLEAGGRDDARTEARQIILVTLVVGLPFVAVLAVLADSATLLLGGDNWSGEYNLSLVLRLLLPAQLFSVVATAVAVCLTMYKRESTIARVMLIAALLQLSAAVLFIGQYDVMGAVISRMVGSVVLLIALLRVLAKEFGRS